MRIRDWRSDVCSSDLLGEEGVALGLVGRRSLVELRLGLGHLALLHVLHRAAQLVDGNRRLLLRIAVLHGLDDGVDVDRFTAFDQVAAEVVTERIAQLAFLGRGVLGRGGAGDQGQGSERSEEQTSELQSLMSISYAVLCLKKKKK